MLLPLAAQTLGMALHELATNVSLRDRIWPRRLPSACRHTPLLPKRFQTAQLVSAVENLLRALGGGDRPSA